MSCNQEVRENAFVRCERLRPHSICRCLLLSRLCCYDNNAAPTDQHVNQDAVSGNYYNNCDAAAVHRYRTSAFLLTPTKYHID